LVRSGIGVPGKAVDPHTERGGGQDIGHFGNIGPPFDPVDRGHHDPIEARLWLGTNPVSDRTREGLGGPSSSVNMAATQVDLGPDSVPFEAA
jgi:hypothetical protein